MLELCAKRMGSQPEEVNGHFPCTAWKHGMSQGVELGARKSGRPKLALGVIQEQGLLAQRAFRDMSVRRYFDPCFKGTWACDPPVVARTDKT